MVVRTLLADDNLQLLKALSDVLADDPGFEVVAAVTTGGEAALRARDLQPDVAVLDVDMPGGGADLVRDLKALSPALRVLIFSGRDDVDVVVSMLQAGASAFVTKGSLAGDFPTCVRRCAEGAVFVLAGCADEVLDRLARPDQLATTTERADALPGNRP